MTLDNDAIFKAYPNVKSIRGDIAFDNSGKKVTLVQSKIDEARSTLDTDYAKVKYKDDRKKEYPSITDQLDDIYHNGIDAWKATIKKTKDKYPKP